MSIAKFEKHWAIVLQNYKSNYGAWDSVLDDLVVLVEEGAKHIAGLKKPLENAIYILFTKALNHALSTQILIGRGLLIDSALTTRNALETLLLIQAFLIDPEETYADKWLKGKQFQPSWARNQLKSVKDRKVREVVITLDDDTNQMAYSWLSDITHANLSGFSYIAKESDKNSYVLHLGGSISGEEKFVKAIFAVLTSVLHSTSIISSCVFDHKWYEGIATEYKSIENRINRLSKT
jgi:hypothetical protein